MNPPLFCPLCYPKQNLRFFFLENSPFFFLNASARRRRRHKYQTPCSPSRPPPRSSPPRRRSSSTRYYYRVYRSHRLCSSKSSFYRFQKRDDQHSFFSSRIIIRVQNAIRFFDSFSGSILDLRGGGGGALAGVEKRGRTPRRRDRSNR